MTTRLCNYWTDGLLTGRPGTALVEASGSVSLKSDLPDNEHLQAGMRLLLTCRRFTFQDLEARLPYGWRCVMSGGSGNRRPGTSRWCQVL
jgi:hypothetical protein